MPSVPISFTFDVICPFTYLAKKRLNRALANAKTENVPADFTIIFRPFQLYPDAPKVGEDTWSWYKHKKYGDSEEKMQMYARLMQEQGAPEGINFKFTGTIANTFDAHRLVQHYQETEGSSVANKLVEALYVLYFEQEKHPSSPETLLEAAKMAGIDEKGAKEFIESHDEVMETKMAIQEQMGNYDSVPVVVFEGRRRDITVVGTTEDSVAEYEKAIKQIIKEL